jgi:peroxiredoxin
MNYTRKFLMLFSVCFVLFADLYAQSAAHITADIAGLGNGKVFFSYELDNLIHKDSVIADQGKFTKNMMLPESVLCTLSNVVNQQIRIFLLNHSPVKISGDVSKFHALSILGAQEHDLLTQFRNSMYRFPGTKPTSTGNPEADKKARLAFAAIQQEKKDSVVSGLVSAYPQHIAAAIVVYDMYVTYPNRIKALQNYKLLSAVVQKSYYGRRIKIFTDAEVNTKAGARAANFSLADKDGKMFSLSDFKGKYILIDFWASWCVPCRKENPNLIKAYQQYKDKGFTIVGLSMDSSTANWLTAVGQDKLPWMQLNDPQSTTGKVADTYGVKSLPANFLVAPDGKIVARNLRGDALQKKLKQLIH